MFAAESDEPLFDDPSIFFEQDKNMDDLLAEWAPASEGNGINEKGAQKRPRKKSSASLNRESKNDGCSSSSRKTVHREIERQRRQEMAGLYASLRSLLPLEYVKGKRAISDHMDQAISYIRDMQKKTEEMNIRRDNLKKSSSVAGAAINPNSNLSYNSPYFVKINLFRDEMEILISSSFNEESFPLSKVVADLLGRGLNVVSCLSTRGDRCYLHKLHIELNESTSIDPRELQDRLANLIKTA